MKICSWAVLVFRIFMYKFWFEIYVNEINIYICVHTMIMRYTPTCIDIEFTFSILLKNLYCMMKMRSKDD